MLPSNLEDDLPLPTNGVKTKFYSKSKSSLYDFGSDFWVEIAKNENAGMRGRNRLVGMKHETSLLFHNSKLDKLLHSGWWKEEDVLRYLEQLLQFSSFMMYKLVLTDPVDGLG